MNESHISYQSKAPYYTLHQLTQETERVWIVFHGYGQLARYFIRKFDVLAPNKNVVIAPQGLSKHYQSGFTGRVGASWMTKEDRLQEIENQMSYLDAMLDSFPAIIDKELIYFGFSQGVATMCRFAAHRKLSFSKMVLWAGTFPPELVAEDFRFLNGNEQVMYFTGSDDPLYKEGMKEHQLKIVKEVMEIDAQVHVFDGTHEVIPALIATL